MIVNKDSDFYEKNILYGHPPKVILIKRGNCINRQIQLILRNKIYKHCIDETGFVNSSTTVSNACVVLEQYRCFHPDLRTCIAL